MKNSEVGGLMLLVGVIFSALDEAQLDLDLPTDILAVAFLAGGGFLVTRKGDFL